MIRFLLENWVFIMIAVLGWIFHVQRVEFHRKMKICIEEMGGEYEKCEFLIGRGLFDGSFAGP